MLAAWLKNQPSPVPAAISSTFHVTWNTSVRLAGGVSAEHSLLFFLSPVGCTYGTLLNCTSECRFAPLQTQA